MPELPDLIVYREALESRVLGKPIQGVRIQSPSLLRSFDPPISSTAGAIIRGITLLGKRIVFELRDERYLLLHLMIAGRLHWKPRGTQLRRKADSAAIDFEDGTLLLTEASTKKRATLYLVRGREALAVFDRGGISPLDSGLEDFRHALGQARHTLKRALSDPAILSGVGNAYSDEILHHARLSPLRHTTQLTDEEMKRLHNSTREVLAHWIGRLRQESSGAFPEKVTAFRSGMAVHGRFGEPCPACGTRVQRIVYAENECNYCPRCQTEGRLLSDRALARLLKEDWPATIEELESREASQAYAKGPLAR
jgi:formamidopyrimidine-DNA glycosylase